MSLDLTPSELAQLAALQLTPDDVIGIEVGVGQIQQVGNQADPPLELLAFVAALPAGFIRTRAPIFGPSGEQIGGGLGDAIPIPPTVRLLVRRSHVNATAAPVPPPAAPPAPANRPGPRSGVLALALAGALEIPEPTARRTARQAAKANGTNEDPS